MANMNGTNYSVPPTSLHEARTTHPQEVRKAEFKYLYKNSHELTLRI